MLQFATFALHTYVFSMQYPEGWVSPFRNLRIKAYLPAPRSLSQAITSFIACNRQGIHHMLLVTWPYNFDLCCQKSPYSSSKTCEVSHLTRYAVMWISLAVSFNTALRIFVITWIQKVEFVLTQSNNCWRHGHLKGCFRQQYWFRLYEFLKNSLLRFISIQKHSEPECFCIAASQRL